MFSVRMSRPDTTPRSLRIFAIVVLCVSIFFWAWALYNTITKQFDAGVVSFLLAAIASTYLLFTKAPNKVGQCLVVASYLLVSINYMAGVVFAFTVLNRPGFGIYCIIFAVLWIGIAVVGNSLMSKSRKAPGNGNRERDPIKTSPGT
jgi:FlaA1/EpsC-like NDP-sugar epimerase